MCGQATHSTAGQRQAPQGTAAPQALRGIVITPQCCRRALKWHFAVSPVSMIDIPRCRVPHQAFGGAAGGGHGPRLGHLPESSKAWLAGPSSRRLSHPTVRLLPQHNRSLHCACAQPNRAELYELRVQRQVGAEDEEDEFEERDRAIEQKYVSLYGLDPARLGTSPSR